MFVNITDKQYYFVNELIERNTTDMIVIHHTGGADIDAKSEDIHQWHIDAGYAGIGYHFVIRKNGEIERGRPEWSIGAHAYGENWHTIGIHLSGDFNIGSPSQSQIEACSMLCAFISEKYKFEPNKKTIVGHCDLMSTDCPGKNLYSELPTIIGKANFYRYNSPDIITCPYCGK